MDPELQRLVDRTAIVDTVVGWANAFDAQDWTRMRHLLAPELWVDYREFRGEPPAIVAADEYVESRRRALTGLRTLHVITNFQVAIEGETAICVSAYRIYRIDPNVQPPDNTLETGGRYEHGLVRTAEGWKIRSVQQTVVLRAGNPAIHGALKAATSD